MFEVRTNVGINRIYATLWGHVSDAEAREIGDRMVHDLTTRLRPGFDLISDVSRAEPMSEFGLGQLKRIMETALRHRIRRVVRVVGRSAHTTLQFERVSRELGYAAYLCFSLEEAERVLDGEE